MILRAVNDCVHFDAIPYFLENMRVVNMEKLIIPKRKKKFYHHLFIAFMFLQKKSRASRAKK